MIRRRLAQDAAGLGTHSTDLEQSVTIEAGNSLHRRIKSWLVLQRLYAPLTSALRTQLEEADTSAVPPWQIPLLLPSHSAAARKCYDRRLVRYEFQFRVAQAEMALRALRALLLYKSHMLISRKGNVSGTVAITRSSALIQDIANRVGVEVKRYQKAREILQDLWPYLKTGSIRALGDSAEWEKVIHPLHDSDVVTITSLDGINLGEGDKALSWIWTAAGTGQDMSEVAHNGMYPTFALSCGHIFIDSQLFESNSAERVHEHSAGRKSASLSPQRWAVWSSFSRGTPQDGSSERRLLRRG